MFFGKKLLNIVLAVALVFSMLTPATISVQAEELASEQAASTVQTQVKVEGINGAIKELTTIELEAGKTALDALTKLLDAENISYNVEESSYGPYVTEINGLVNGHLNGWDGWSYTVNDQDPGVGMGGYSVKEDDEIVVYYSKWPVLSASPVAQVITVDLIGDVFTEQAADVANWQLPADVTLQQVEKVTDQQVKLTVQTEVEQFTLTALAAALSSNQETDVEVTFTDLAAERVKQLINNLPTIKEANETNELALQEARAAFDALTAEEQALVTNINELVEKEQAFTTLNTDVTVKVNVRVEGIKGTILNVKDFAVTAKEKVTAAEATKQVLTANGIDYKYSPTADYFRAIAGESDRGLGAGSGWMYKVNGTYPDVYGSAVTLKDGDEIVWDYINSFSLVEDLSWPGFGVLMYSGTEAVDKVTFNPIIEMPTVVEVGEDVRISITGKYNQVSYLYEPISGPHTIPLADVSIEYNGKVYVTNEQGEAVIPSEDVQAGKYELRFTKDLPGTIFTDDGEKQLDSFPRIIRTYKPLEVKASAQVAAAKQALERAKDYLVANKALVSEHVNSSHSSFWMLTAMTGAGIDVATYPWATSPTTSNTFWTTALTAPAETSNEIAGILIGAKALGLDPTNVKGRNQINDLLAKQNTTTQLFSTVWGEAFSLIALDVTAASYDKQKHIEAILKLQDAQTGYIGDIDSTGWALFALAPYKDQPKVKAAIDKAVASYYKVFHEEGFIDNANTMASMISGLASVGENVFSSKWTYEKDGQKVNIVGHLLAKYVMADGGVRWKAADTQSNLMALEQVYIALADAVNGQSTFASLKAKTPKAPAPTEVNTNPSTPNPGGSTGGGTVVVPTEQVVTVSITNKSTGDILRETEVKLNKGDTAFSVLQRVTNDKGIELNVRSTSYGKYIVGIGGVKEFDGGAQSGWMYKVNGDFPTESANTYAVNAGDYVEWVYTKDLGKDVGSSGGGGSVTPTTPTVPSTTTGGTGAQKPTEQPTTTATQAEKLEATITADKATQNKPVVVQDKNGGKVEIPSAMLKALQLKENETLQVAVTQQNKQIQVTLEKESDGKKVPVVAGKNYAKVTLPVAATKNTVVLQVVDGELKAVPHKVVNNEIVLFVKASGTFVVSEDKVTFNDIEKLANKEDIEFLASRHIIKGKEAGNFAPNDNVTRAQFAALVSRALGLQAVEASNFADTKGKWYEADVQALLEAGITTGKTATTFDPGANVTREQGAAFMARILAYTGYEAAPTKSATFKDDASINKAYKENIDLLVELGIMSGKGDGTFDAKGKLTRDQLAKMLKRTLTISGLM